MCLLLFSWINIKNMWIFLEFIGINIGESIGISYGFLFIFFGDDLCYFVTKNAQVSQSAGKEKDYGFS